MDQRTNPDAGQYAALSPFELKDELIRWARDFTQQKAATHQFLERGARQPELDRHHAARGVLPARPVRAAGVEARLGRARSSAACRTPRASPSACARSSTDASGDGARLLGACARLRRRDARVRRRRASSTSSSTAIVGDNYPVPDRMLVHAETVVQQLPREDDVRRPPARRASSTSSPSRAARPPCATCSAA